MATPTPEVAAAKWSRNLSASTETIREGVNRVTESPGQAASRAVDTWQARVSSPEAREKFQRGTARVTTEEWREAMIAKGIPRIATGASQGQNKMRNFLADFLPFVDDVARRVRQMPKNTLEDRIARMVAQVRGNAAYRRRA